MSTPNGNGNGNGRARNAAAHGATTTLTSGIGAFTGLYISRRYGIDSEVAIAAACAAVGTAMGVLGAVLGGTGVWARERKAAGDTRLTIALLALLG